MDFTSFIAGLGLGLLLTVFLARICGRTLRQTLFGEDLTSTKAGDDFNKFLAIQKTDEAQFYEDIKAEPAVPVTAQPPEITPDIQEIARSAPNPDVARQLLRARIQNSDVADALALLIRWTPRRHSSEDKYQVSFRSHATKNDYSGRIQEKPKVTWGMDGKDPTRVAYPDFVLGNPNGPEKNKVLLEQKPTYLLHRRLIERWAKCSATYWLGKNTAQPY